MSTELDETVPYEQELGLRIADHLRREAGLTDVGDLAVLPGGHSGLTYRLSTAPGREAVVKAVPRGQRSVGRHDMLKQARILAALAGTDVPVPAVVAVDETEPAWFAVDFVTGESLEPTLDDPAIAPDVAAARMVRAAEILPRLHRVPLDSLPSGASTFSPAEELARWARTMGAVPAELVPGAAMLQARLEASIPSSLAPTLVHGDYRLGNIICAGLEPVAVIDWEIWSIGDPRVELGWFLVFADGSNFPGVGREVPGLPSEADLLAVYADGAAPPAMDWFNALGRFKMAAIMGHNLRRHREGRHDDPDQEKLPDTIVRLITSGQERLG
ncbi:phosphotransferase family protein [Aeromicrobium endophyticum]|uniref:Phosphotransferase family protein n=1 Tax=Aeromicrobium endophyticum TaxID=2292704 RepID=A0A371P9S5_9ACTN|nr:phosphotransferase family protein [Aeromicrobium endophyticum]REK72675.1 phosphotransferase family protein [Aeromicrobium endophyticum]